PAGALLDGLLDRVGDAAILAGLGLWAGRWTATAPGGAGADRGRDHRGVVVDGVQGPGSRPGAATCARAAAGVAAGRPGREAAAWRRGGGAWSPGARPCPPSRPPRRCRSACESPSCAVLRPDSPAPSCELG